MNLEQLQNFWTVTQRPPGTNLTLYLQQNPEHVLKPNELEVAERHLRWLSEELVPQARADLNEARGKAEASINLQPPRTWQSLRQRWEAEEGSRLRSKLDGLVEEQRTLKAAIERTKAAEADRRRREIEGMVKSVTKRAADLAERIKTKPRAVDLAIELASLLNGMKLDKAFLPLLRAASDKQNLQVEARWLREEHGLRVELPDLPPLDYVQGLSKALSALLGEPVEVPVTVVDRRWRRVAAEQRNKDLDAAAIAKAKVG
jgi:hypothetical protein